MGAAPLNTPVRHPGDRIIDPFPGGAGQEPVLRRAVIGDNEWQERAGQPRSTLTQRVGSDASGGVKGQPGSGPPSATTLSQPQLLVTPPTARP